MSSVIKLDSQSFFVFFGERNGDMEAIKASPNV